MMGRLSYLLQRTAEERPQDVHKRGVLTSKLCLPRVPSSAPCWRRAWPKFTCRVSCRVHSYVSSWLPTGKTSTISASLASTLGTHYSTQRQETAVYERLGPLLSVSINEMHLQLVDIGQKRNSFCVEGRTSDVDDAVITSSSGSLDRLIARWSSSHACEFVFCEQSLNAVHMLCTLWQVTTAKDCIHSYSYR